MSECATYRAACGDEIVDGREGAKPKKMSNVVMGWIGDERCKDPDMRTNRDVPERCKTCRYSKKAPLHFFHEETKNFYDVTAWSCYSYRKVDDK